MATGRKRAESLRPQKPNRSLQSEQQLVLNTIYEFCRLFDQQDWKALRRCLAATLDTDYSSFRGTPPTRMSADEFVVSRRRRLSGLVTQHLTVNHLLKLSQKTVSCRFDFVIHRWPEDNRDLRFFHSFGFYEVVLRRMRRAPYGGAIESIKQHVVRSVGHPELHGGRPRNTAPLPTKIRARA